MKIVLKRVAQEADLSDLTATVNFLVLADDEGGSEEFRIPISSEAAQMLLVRVAAIQRGNQPKQMQQSEEHEPLPNGGDYPPEAAIFGEEEEDEAGGELEQEEDEPPEELEDEEGPSDESKVPSI